MSIFKYSETTNPIMSNEFITWLHTLPNHNAGALAILVHPFYDINLTPSYLPALREVIPRIRAPLLVIEDNNIAQTRERLQAYGLTAPHHVLRSVPADSTLADVHWDDVTRALRRQGYDHASLLGGYRNKNPESGCLIGVRNALRQGGISASIREDATYGM
jgi:sugar phosphate isomerase/epimerase